MALRVLTVNYIGYYFGTSGSPIFPFCPVRSQIQLQSVQNTFFCLFWGDCSRFLPESLSKTPFFCCFEQTLVVLCPEKNNNTILLCHNPLKTSEKR